MTFPCLVNKVHISLSYLYLCRNHQVHWVMSNRYMIPEMHQLHFHIHYGRMHLNILPKNNIVYEPLTNDYINNKITLLTEGSFDSIYANQYGYNAMAIIGGAISRSNYIDSELSLIDYIIEKCKHYNNELILCFDNDKAGINFTKQFRKYSKQIIKRIDFTLLNKPVKDLQDINKQELDFLVNNATIM